MNAPEIPAPFVPYACSLGTVVGHDGNGYRIANPDGRTIGIAANGEPSEEHVEADIANPPAPVVAPREINKLVTVERLIALGKVAAFMAFLDANGGVLRLLWDSSNSLRTDHAMFTTYAPAFKAALELTDEQFTALIAP